MYFHFQPGELTQYIEMDVKYKWALINKKYRLWLCRKSLESTNENTLTVSRRQCDRDKLKQMILNKSKVEGLNADDFFLVGGFK